jgi:hypothetical protein
MINYSFKPTEIRVIFVNESMPDYVKFIDGIVYAEKDGITLFQEVKICVPTVDVDNYVDYSSLTEEEVIQMFENAIDPDYYNVIKDRLASELNDIFINQFPYVKPLPWL